MRSSSNTNFKYKGSVTEEQKTPEQRTPNPNRRKQRSFHGIHDPSQTAHSSGLAGPHSEMTETNTVYSNFQSGFGTQKQQSSMKQVKQKAFAMGATHNPDSYTGPPEFGRKSEPNVGQKKFQNITKKADPESHQQTASFGGLEAL